MPFTEVFGGSVIYPSQTSYLSLEMDEDQTLSWPIEQQIGGNIVADIIDVNALSPGLSISLGDARQVTTGYTALFNNVGGEDVDILNSNGDTIATISSGDAWQIYLYDNSTAAGLWRTFQYGAGVSTANAASLAGLGIKAISTTLNLAFQVTSTNTTPTTLTSDGRAKFYNWTGGVGILNLPSAAAVGNDWNVILRNSGTGTWTVTPPSGTIDGASTKALRPGESCIVVTDGTNYFTMSGNGGSSGSGFSFISINVAGAGDYILSGVELNQIGYSFTGILTGDRSIVVPGTTQEYWVGNNTTGPFTLSLRTSTQVGGVQVSQTTTKILACDGSNVYDATSANSVTYPIPVAQGGTGATSAAVARTNLGVPPNTRAITGAGALTGGGDLSSDRTITMSFLGFQNLADPNADRIAFWDDSDGAFKWLEVGEGLSLTGTVLSSDVESGSYVATFTGFTVDQMKMVYYRRIGSLVTLQFEQFTATSNSANWDEGSGNMPVTIRPSTHLNLGGVTAADNSVFSIPASVDIDTSGNMHFFNLLTGGPWTNSGAKGFTNSGGRVMITYDMSF